MAGHVEFKVSEQWQGETLDRVVKAAGRAGTRAAAERLRAYAVPLAPLDLGPLRSSASVKGINAEPVAILIFDAPYAAVQHERLDYQHDDGQAKYVEEPMTEHARELQAIIAKVVGDAIHDA